MSSAHKKKIERLLENIQLKKVPFYCGMFSYSFGAVLLYCCFVTSFAYSSILVQVFGAMLGGLSMWLVMQIFHYTSHAKKKSFLLKVAGCVLSFPPAIWARQHIVEHHNYTNESDLDGDIENLPLVSKVSRDSRFPFSLVLIVAYALYSSNVILGKLRLLKKDKENRLAIIVAFFAHMTLFLVIPILIGQNFQNVFACFVIVHVTVSLIATFVIQPAHCGLKQKTFIQNSGKKDFFRHQLETTANFATHNSFLTWFTGGLNFQVEHHLFPKMHPYHLPRIAKEVKKYCVDNNIPYLEHRSMLAAIIDHMRFMKQLEAPVEVGA